MLRIALLAAIAALTVLAAGCGGKTADGLEPCVACGKPISPNAEACPHCGEPVPSRSIRNAITKRKIEEARDTIRGFDIGRGSFFSAIDPWGRRYNRDESGKRNASRGHRVEDIWSDGPDGISDTEDDIGNWEDAPIRIAEDAKRAAITKKAMEDLRSQVEQHYKQNQAFPDNDSAGRMAFEFRDGWGDLPLKLAIDAEHGTYRISSAGPDWTYGTADDLRLDGSVTKDR